MGSCFSRRQTKITSLTNRTLWFAHQKNLKSITFPVSPLINRVTIAIINFDAKLFEIFGIVLYYSNERVTLRTKPFFQSPTNGRHPHIIMKLTLKKRKKKKQIVTSSLKLHFNPPFHLFPTDRNRSPSVYRDCSRLPHGRLE